MSAFAVAIGGKADMLVAPQMSAFDPKRTSGLPLNPFQGTNTDCYDVVSIKGGRDEATRFHQSGWLCSWYGRLSPMHSSRATPVIGFLSSRSPDESKHVLAAFHKGLRRSRIH